MRSGRSLIPVDYTRSGRCNHDLAVPTQPLPGLQAAVTLGTLADDRDAYEFLRTRLTRERNRLAHALTMARRAIVEVVPA